MLLDVAIQKPMLYADFVEKEIVLLFMYLCFSIVLSSGPQYLVRQLRNSFVSNHDSWEFKVYGNWKKPINSLKTVPTTTLLIVDSSKNKISQF